MRNARKTGQLMLPMGGQIVERLMSGEAGDVDGWLETPQGRAVFDTVQYVMNLPPEAAFQHSVLCAMSLPTRRPKDEFAPIIRRDGFYTLVINPVERMKMVDGELTPVRVGVPYGVLARLVMMYIMGQAVKSRSREIYLGNSFAAWMRRMGITNTNSGGKRSSRALLQEQIERLMSCEWTFRWDQTISAADEGRAPRRKEGKGSKPGSFSAFAVNDMRLVNQYAGVSTGSGEFVTKFVLSEPF